MIKFWKLTKMKLQWKLTTVFGILSILGITITAYIIYNYTVYILDKELNKELSTIAQLIKSNISINELREIKSVHDSYYKQLKEYLKTIQNTFYINWVAIYRFNGKYFEHIVDGANFWDEYIPNYPIFDTQEELMNAWNNGQIVYSPHNEDAFGCWASVFYPIIDSKNNQTVAIIDVSKSKIFLNKFRKEIFYKSFLLTILAVLFTLLICVIFSKFITKPIYLLTQAAKKVSEGNLEEKIYEITSKDEIGILVNAFNKMIDELKANRIKLEFKLNELSTLYEISQKVNFASSIEEVLKIILDKTIQGLKSEKGCILLYDEETYELKLSITSGDESNEFEVLGKCKAKSSENIHSKVFENKEPIVINSNADKFLKSHITETSLNIKNILCVPLLVEQRCIGVISICNKRYGNFDKSDIEMAMTIASQIALSIEKARLFELSITDGLTKLYVHRYFQASLSNEIKRAKRYNKPLSLILFDIDHFKKFNDTYGHQMGDLVLAGVANIVKNKVRNVDIPARYGGEEFAIILPETNVDSAQLVAERLRSSVESYEFISPDNIKLKVTISIGIASFPIHATDKLELIKFADSALYESKKQGRNRVTVYSPPNI